MFKVCTTQYGYSWDTRIIPGHTTKIIFTEKQQTDLIIPKSFIKKINMYSAHFLLRCQNRRRKQEFSWIQ